MVLKVDTEETKPILNGKDQIGASGCIHNASFTHQVPMPKISDPIEALDYFSSAVTVKDVSLARRCVEFLNKNLNRDNVLFVLRNISKHKYSTPENFLPSAPPQEDKSQENHREDCIEDLIDNLRNNCLLEIDKHGEFVLKSKDVLQLDYKDMLCITTRDGLQVSSELVVYNAVVNWGTEECKKRGERCPENLRKVLGELVYAPRYGLMSSSEFLNKTPDGIKGPQKLGILKCKEVERMIEHIKAKRKNQRGPELPYKCSHPRRNGTTCRQLTGKESNCSSNNTCEKHIINFLSCWTAVFD